MSDSVHMCVHDVYVCVGTYVHSVDHICMWHTTLCTMRIMCGYQTCGMCVTCVLGHVAYDCMTCDSRVTVECAS